MTEKKARSEFVRCCTCWKFSFRGPNAAEMLQAHYESDHPAGKRKAAPEDAASMPLAKP